MVNRVYVFTDELVGGEVDEVFGEETVASDTNVELLELWFANVAAVEYSLRINETKHIDSLPGDDAPIRSDRLVFEASLSSGDTIQFQASETANAAATPAAYLLVEET